MQPAGLQHGGKLPRERAVREEQADDGRGEDEDGLREDDRHDAGVIDLERQVLRLAAEDLAADDALGVLHGNLALRLRDGDDRRDHDEQEGHHEDEHERTHLAGLIGAVAARHEGAPRLDERGGQARHDADGDDERDAVADALVGDLITQPHEQHGAGGEREHGQHAEADAGVATPAACRGAGWCRRCRRGTDSSSGSRRKARAGSPGTRRE